MKQFTTSQRLEQIMRSRNMRQVDILNAAEPYCRKYGIKLGKNDLSQYVSGKVEPGQDKLTILGLALNVSEAWLSGSQSIIHFPAAELRSAVSGTWQNALGCGNVELTDRR